MTLFDAALFWSVLITVDLLCIVGFLNAEAIGERVYHGQKKGAGWLSKYRLFMASWGTGRKEPIVWTYRLIFVVAACVVTWVLSNELRGHH
jgi:hypothetical protein